MTDAFTLFRSSLPAAFHRQVIAQIKTVSRPSGIFHRMRRALSGWPEDWSPYFSDIPYFNLEEGHGLRLLVPDVLRILQDTAVADAVTRMLGPGAVPDGCMHMHRNNRAEDGAWHPDDYCGRPWPTDRAMAILCYFPQDTPPEMGPTEVRWDGRKILATGPAGTCLLMRHDVEHRSTANRTGRPRLMLKFLFSGATGTFRDHTEGGIA